MLKNQRLQSYAFLQGMYDDGYFPNFLVDKGKAILVSLCEQIEKTKPLGDEVLKLTHAATEEFNELAEEFGEHGSEIETAARDCIGTDFASILEAYGYDIDVEEAIAPRDW